MVEVFMVSTEPVYRRATDNPIVAFDVQDGEEVMLIPYELIISGDNPMQVEECSHGGLKCNYFCRTCKVGGTNAEKKTDKGYGNIFQVFSRLSTLDKLTTSVPVW